VSASDIALLCERANRRRADAGKDAYVSKFPSAAGKKDEEDERPKIKRGKYDGLSRRLKRRKMAIEADEAEGRARDQSASIRAAKKAQRPGRITEPLVGSAKKKGAKGKGKSAGAGAAGAAGGKPAGKRSAFDEPARAKKHEGMRAAKVKVNLNKKGKVGGKGKGVKGKGKK
jgi:ATP-dependent RNA helicase DDX27